MCAHIGEITSDTVQNAEIVMNMALHLVIIEDRRLVCAGVDVATVYDT